MKENKRNKKGRTASETLSKKKVASLISTTVVLVIMFVVSINFSEKESVKLAEENIYETLLGDEVTQDESLTFDNQYIHRTDIDEYVGDGHMELEEGMVEIKDSTLSTSPIYDNDVEAIERVLEELTYENYDNAFEIAMTVNSEKGKTLQTSINLILNLEDEDYTAELDVLLPFFNDADVMVQYYLNSEHKNELIYLDATEIIIKTKPTIYNQEEIDSFEVPFLNDNFYPSEIDRLKFYKYELYLGEYLPPYDLYVVISNEGQSKIYYGKYRKGDDGNYHRRDGTITEVIPTLYSDIK